MAFVECAGNSAPMFSKEPMQATAQMLHGLVSNSEWTGVPLSTLLDEAGIDPKAKWLVAEGADAQLLDRSVPVKKAYDDALVAIYQNGEHLMPGNGYPMRLLLPGYQGNMNVKFLRRIKVVDQPAYSYFETKNYSQILPGGKTWRFHFVMEVKSFITHPSFGLTSRSRASTPSPASPIRAPGASPRSWCRPTAARAGAKPRCKGRSTKRPSRASSCRGAGTASRRCCKAAPRTTAATCSRCAPISSRSAARPASR